MTSYSSSGMLEGLGPRALAVSIRLLPHLVALILLMLLLLPGGLIQIALPAQSDTLLHLGFFLVWTGLWRWLDPPRPTVAVFTVAAMAAGTELVQLWVPGRHGSWSDLLADLVGAGLGWWLASRYSRRLTNTVSNQF